MRYLAVSLLAALILVSAGYGATLREQLALAEEAEDAYAQIELVRRILETEPGDDALRENLIALWLQIADYDMAEAALKDWPKAPEDIAASTRAEILYNRDNKPGEAIALLRQYHAQDPGDLAITGQLARYLGALKEDQALVELLSSAPGVNEDAGLLLARAAARRRLNDFEGALGDFNLAEKADAETAANARASYDRLKAALPQIKEATARLDKTPGDFPALAARAYWLLAADAAQLARPDAEAACKIAPDSVAARLVLSRATRSASQAREEFFVNLGVADPPPESFARLLELDQRLIRNPGDGAALVARSFELNEAPAQYQLALNDAEAALALDPSSADARLEKIYALIKLGRPEDAEAEIPVMESTKPPGAKMAQAYALLADACLGSYRLDAALDYATRALKARPTAAVYKTRAAVLQRLGRDSEAAEDLAKAQQLKK